MDGIIRNQNGIDKAEQINSFFSRHHLKIQYNTMNENKQKVAGVKTCKVIYIFIYLNFRLLEKN